MTPDRPATCMSLRQLADGEVDSPLLDAMGGLVEPLVLVDLDVPIDPALLAQAGAEARACERVLVGVRTGEPPGEQWDQMLESLDLTITTVSPGRTAPSCVPLHDPAAAARALHAAAIASPQAALALAQVLRATETLDVRSALNVESFAYSTLLGGSQFRRWLASRPVRVIPQPGPEPAVIAERSGGLLRVTLNRPARRNAYSRELRDALTEALAVPALDDTIIRVVLAGAGPSFCSGGDLDEFGTTPDPGIAHFIRTNAGAGILLHHIAARTETRVHGACVGAGIELAAFAGQVVAAPGTTFRLPEVAMGLIPGAGGTVSLPRRIGRWRTLYLALSGVSLDADTAECWGLADQLVTEC